MSLSIRDFPGLVVNRGQKDLELGQSRYQLNVVNRRTGELPVRRGMRVVSFDAEPSAPTGQICYLVTETPCYLVDENGCKIKV